MKSHLSTFLHLFSRNLQKDENTRKCSFDVPGYFFHIRNWRGSKESRIYIGFNSIFVNRKTIKRHLFSFLPYGLCLFYTDSAVLNKKALFSIAPGHGESCLMTGENQATQDLTLASPSLQFP